MDRLSQVLGQLEASFDEGTIDDHLCGHSGLPKGHETLKPCRPALSRPASQLLLMVNLLKTPIPREQYANTEGPKTAELSPTEPKTTFGQALLSE
jgi:hypothetical protein